VTTESSDATVGETGDRMSELLEKAFAEVAKLPERDQDAIAEWLLEELHSEREWERTLADSSDVLSRLADEALEEHREGRTRPLAPNER